MLQTAVIVEGILRRVLLTLVGATLTPREAAANNSLYSAAVAFLSQIFTLPIQVAYSMLVFVAARAFTIAVVVLVVAALWGFIGQFDVLIASTISSYNLVFAPVLNALLQLVSLFQEIFHVAFALWNFVRFIIGALLTKVLAPLTIRWPSEMAEIVENLGLFLYALATSISTWLVNIADCATVAADRPCGAETCVWQEVDIACYGSVNHLSLDLMTPGLYSKRVFNAVITTISQDCSALTVMINILLSPALDVNLYKFVHSVTNVFFYGIGWVIAQHQRCRFLERGYARGEFTFADKNVGCAPDLAPLEQLVSTILRSLGATVDNLLDTALIQTEIFFEGSSRGECSSQAVSSLVLDASDVFEDPQERLRIVGIGASSTAVVSSRSVVVRRPKSDAWSIAAFPIAVDVRMGVAPISYSETEDLLADEPSRTRSDGAHLPNGLFGCTCYGSKLQCASVAFTGPVDDSALAANESTIHRLFTPEGESVACGLERTSVQVTPLRFSRRRLGKAVGLGADASATDTFDLLGLQGDGVLSAEADAAVFIHGWCNGKNCADQCVPWCMGLHVAGAGNHNMTIFPAARWEEFISVRQSDCGVAAYNGEECSSDIQADVTADVEIGDGRVRRARCGLEFCEPSTRSVTAVAVSNQTVPPALLASKTQRTLIRLLGQPFVVAGDTMLTVELKNANDYEVVVSRLISLGASNGPEQLTLASNAHTIPVTDCAAADHNCVAAAAASGSLALPRAVFSSVPTGMPAAQSEWAVHWASNPATEVWQAVFERCRAPAGTFQGFAIIVSSAYSRARVWTAKTTRAVDLTGIGDKQAGAVAYMRVPGFFDGVNVSCSSVMNLRIVGVEYVNMDNVLVSVLAGRIEDYDASTNDLVPGAARVYNYYWLNPNRHDCVDIEEGDGAHFTCWRSEAAGMWTSGETSHPSAAARGQLCPAAQRMPKIGSIFAELALLPFTIVGTFLETMLTVLPALSDGLSGVARLFRPRLRRLTLHTALDSGGHRIFSFDRTNACISRFSHLAAEVPLRIVRLFNWMPELQESGERVTTGVAHVAAYASQDVLALADWTLTLQRIKGIPMQGLTSGGNGVFEAFSTGGMSAVVGTIRQATNRLRSATGLVLRSIRQVIITAIINSGRRRPVQAALNAASAEGYASNLQGSNPKFVLRDAVLKSVAELRPIVRSTFTDGLLWQCHGLGQIVGLDTVVGKALRQSCSINADLIESFLTVVEVMFVDYPLVNCLCKFDETERTMTGSPGNIDNVGARCLPRLATTELHAWALDLVFASDNRVRQDLCFAAMDTANIRLERAFDAPAARLVQISDTLGAALQELASVGPVAGSASCDSYATSAYSAVVIPFPVDFFMQCLEAPSCRPRCLAEFSAFEEAKRSAAAAVAGHPPRQRKTVPLQIESAFFSAEDVDSGRDQAPFEVLHVLELTAPVCLVMCKKSDPCVLVVGMLSSSMMAQAIVCLPQDISAYSRYVGETSLQPFDLHAEEQVADAHAMTGFLKHESSNTNTSEWSVVLARAPGRARVVVFTGFTNFTLVDAVAASAETLAETPDQVGFWHSLTAVRVVAARSQGESAIVVLRGHRVRARLSVDDESLYPLMRPPIVLEDVCVQARLSFDDNSVFQPWSDWLYCNEHADAVLSLTHRHVCFERSCAYELLLPRITSAPVQLVFHADRSDNNGFLLGETEVIVSRKSSQLARKLGADGRRVLVDTVGGPKLRRVAVSPFTNALITGIVDAASPFSVDVVATYAGRGSWLQVLHVQNLQSKLSGNQRHAWTVERSLTLQVDCQVDNCEACRNTSLAMLPALCYAAQECGVSRCVGTEVQVDKPLCNAGAFLSESLKTKSLLLIATWRAFAHSTAFLVEISERRRERFEVTLPAETTLDLACHSKDIAVRASAVIASALNSVVQGVLKGHQELAAISGIEFDPRVGALSSMAAMALTNMITSFLLAPTYIIILIQRNILCYASTAVLVVENLFTGGLEKPILAIGSVAVPDALSEASTRDSAVSVCVSDFERELARDSDSDGALDVLSSRVSNLVKDMVDAKVSTFLTVITTTIDAVLSWSAGIVRGIADFVQVVDWDNCKLPVIAGERVHHCACGDQGLRIPAAARSATFHSHAFWCSGWLVLPDIEHGSKLVWNPYSLEALLAIPNVAEYVACLTSAAAHDGCGSLRPRSSVLERQGVEVIQVITRCRANYAQKRWDDGALVFGLFDAQTWADGDFETAEAISGQLNDRFESTKAAVIGASKIIPVGVHLDRRVHACLSAAMLASDTQHRCSEFLSTRSAMFQYAEAASNDYLLTDACSGAEAANLPLMLWAGARGRRVPVATIHDIEQSAEARAASAMIGLKTISSEIRAFFKNLKQPNELEAEFQAELEATTLSVEGDELHQSIDCMVLGPYATAEMIASMNTADGRRLSVPTYHRGLPHSRAFESVGAVAGDSGSPVRRAIMKAAAAHTAQNITNQVLVRHAVDIFASAEAALLSSQEVSSSLLCECMDGQPSLECCVEQVEGGFWTSRQDVVSPSGRVLQDLESDTEQVSHNVIVEALELVDAKLWTDETFLTDTEYEAEELSIDVREELRRAQLFSGSALSYSTDEVATSWTKQTLWQHCTGLLNTAFATLPLMSKDMLADLGVDADAAIVDAQSKFSSTESYDQRLHAQEKLVEDILQRAREDSPVFWSHAFRYVPSDSMWCENATVLVDSDAVPAEGDIRMPTLDQVATVASVVSKCVCGWTQPRLDTPGGEACSVPAALCSQTFQASAVQAVYPSFDATAWQQICLHGYTTRDDLFAVLAVIDSDVLKGWREECGWADPSAAWGLMNPDGVYEWLGGNNRPNTTGLDYELASRGLSGMRLGMLSDKQKLKSAGEKGGILSNINKFVNFHHKHSAAQPLCESRLHAKLLQRFNTIFSDHYVPVAQTVHTLPADAACQRWVIERALALTYEEVLGAIAADNTDPRSTEAIRTIEAQRSTNATWHLRCAVQLEQLGSCTLRGVFDMAPSTYQVVPEHCPWKFADDNVVAICGPKWYVTSGCVLRCNGGFYNPCECVAGSAAVSCDEYRITSAGICPEAELTDPHVFVDVGSKLSSLADESGQRTKADVHSILSELQQRVLDEFAKHGIGHRNPNLADTAIDYWTDSNLPNLHGYHPTRACSRAEGSMHGFAHAMTSDAEHDWVVDERVRNATTVASQFAAGHVLCDAGAFSAFGDSMDSYVLQTRWPGAENVMGRADPAIPLAHANVPDYSDGASLDAIIDTMLEFGTSAPSQWSTPLLHDLSENDDDLLRPAAGMLRGWARWFSRSPEARNTGQENVNSHWPLPDPASAHQKSSTPYHATYGSKEATCPPPEQWTCQRDEDCCGTTCSTSRLVCRLSSLSTDLDVPVGICIDKDTCFEHTHCPDDQLCSGEGRCSKPIMEVQNSLDTDIDFRLQAGACSSSAHGVSKRQGVNDYAQTNGMCSMRNWFHYISTVENLPAVNGLVSVSDRLVNRTDEAQAHLLSDLRTFSSTADPCDRDYEHSELGLCAPSDSIVNEARMLNAERQPASVLSAEAVRATTMQGEDKMFHFCDLRQLQRRSGFLSPYRDVFSQEDTMRRVPDTLRRCLEFETCPVMGIDIDGERVARRRVIIASPADTQADVVASLRQRVVWADANGNGTRSYCMLDTELCGASGALVGSTCSSSASCAIDPLVNPVAVVLFGGAQFNQEVLTLNDVRTHCPYACTQRDPFFEAVDESLFVAFANVFDNTYNGAQGRKRAAALTNRLVLSLFGVDSSQRPTTLLSEDKYLSHSRCVLWLSSQLYKLQNLFGDVYRPGATAEQVITNTVPTPALSMYIVQEHALLSVNMRMLWQCAILADRDSKGFDANWFAYATTYSQQDAVMDAFECPDYEAQPVNRMPIRRFLQTSDDVFTVLEDSSTETRMASEIMHDIDKVVIAAFDRLGISGSADFFCVWHKNAPNDASVDTNINLTAYLELNGPQDPNLARGARAPGYSASGLGSYAALLADVRDYLLRENDASEAFNELDWYEWTLQTMLTRGIIVERSAHAFDNVMVTPDIDFLPLYSFANLEDLSTPLQTAQAANSEFKQRPFDVSSYARASATCEPGSFELLEPEFSLQFPFQCSNIAQSNVLFCDGLEGFIGRTFLRRSEALVILLRIVKQLIYTVPDFGVGILTKPTDLALRALFRVEAQPSMPAAFELNQFVKTKGFECSAEDVDFFVESNPANRLLRQCVNKLKSPIAWIVPTQSVLALTISAQVLLSPFLPSFSEAYDGDGFLDSLFTQRNTREDVLPPRYALCYMLQNGPEVINPYWAGDFDWRVGCDTARDIDNVRHYFTTCAMQLSTDGDANINPCDSFPEFSELLKKHTPVVNERTCASRDEEVVWRAISPLAQGLVPLCERAFEPSGQHCEKRHGTFHGHRGAKSATLDESVEVEAEIGLWRAAQKIWRGQRFARLPGLTGLRVRASDIAGHHIVLDVGSDALMTVKCVHMRADSMFSPCRQPVSEWMPNLEANFALQHRALEYKITGAASAWSCPVERMSAWSRLASRAHNSSAKIPVSTRNAFRFQHITSPSVFAHPTVQSVRPPSRLRPAWFLADTHACVDSPVASLDDTVSSHSCYGSVLLADVMTALRSAETWRSVRLVGSSSCNRILDWPHEASVLRDGAASSTASEDPSECNIAKRLPPFAIKTHVPTVSSSKRTWRAGAVCRMGRLRHLHPTPQPVRNDTDLSAHTTAVQRCRTKALHTGVECDVLLQKSRPSLVRVRFNEITLEPPPRTRLLRRNTRPWQQCDPPKAGFRHADGSISDLPATGRHALMSVGRPFHFDTQRAVSAELFRKIHTVLCGNTTHVTDACTDMVSRFRALQHLPSTTVDASFSDALRGILESATQYANNASLHAHPTSHGIGTASAANSDTRWTRPWVFCNASGCFGTIDKATWLDPAVRADTCTRSVSRLAAHNRQSRISFCQLTRATHDLCVRLADWRERIHEQLCVASGLCPVQKFAYSPTAFNIGNNEFVHDTVETFYKESGRECPADEDYSTQQKASNDALLSTCSATQVVQVVSYLQILRRGTHTIAMILWYLTNINIDFLLLVSAVVSPNAVTTAASSLWRSVKNLLSVLANVIDDIFSVLYRALFSAGRMLGFEEIVVWLCGAMNWIEKHVIKDVVCDMFIDWFASIITSIGQFLIDIDDIQIGVIKPFKWMDLDKTGKAVKDFGAELATLAFCDEPDEHDCGSDDEDEEEPLAGTLPSPTRCWSSYTTFFGDTRSLACTKADTCQRSLTDPTLEVCGACPGVDSSTGFEQFGCSPVTKMCTCGVSRAVADTCRTNADCLAVASDAAPAATCGFLDSELRVRPTAAVLPCPACLSQPVCIVGGSGTSELGRCGCALSPTPFARCARADSGTALYPKIDALCLYAPGAADESSFSVAFNGAATAACSAMTPGSIYCAYIPDTLTAGGVDDAYFAVGFRITPRRRLLAIDEQPGKPAVNYTELSALFQSGVCQDALRTDLLPAARRQCLAALHASNASVSALRLQLPPCSFCSLIDFVHAMQTHPLHIVYLATRPRDLFQLVHNHTVVGDAWRIAASAVQAVSVAARALRSEKLNLGADVANSAGWIVAPYGNRSLLNTPPNVTVRVQLSTARRLATIDSLSAAVQDSLQEVLNVHNSYAKSFSDTYNFRFPDTGVVGDAWSADWPPQTATDNGGACSTGEDILSVLKEASGGLQKSLQAVRQRPPLPPPTLPLAWDAVRPRMPEAYSNATLKPAETASTGFIERSFNDGLAYVFELINFRPTLLIIMFQDARDAFTNMLVCDYEAIQTCSSWRVYLVHGMLIVGLGVVVAGAVGLAIGLSPVGVIAVLLFVPALLHLCYGYGLLCTPMVPVCMLQDIVFSVRAVFPELLTVPAPLLRARDDSYNPCYAYNPSASCIKKCSEAPLLYDSWFAPLAWWAAELNLDQALGVLLNSEEYDGHAAIARAVLRDINADLRAAHRLCAVASSYMLAPYLFFAFAVAVLTLVILQNISTLVLGSVLVWSSWGAAVAATDSD